MQNRLSNVAIKASESYLALARSVAESEISKRSITRIPVYVVLYLAVILVTPITRRFPEPTLLFGLFLFVLSMGRLILALKWDAYSANPLLRKTLPIGIYITAMFWGLFCSLSVQYFELGWISFFIILCTVGIAAGEMSALAPSFPTLSSYMFLMLGPAACASFFLVKGLSGTALGIFFTGYMAFLILQGRRQSLEYWERLRESSQMRAMIDSVPGTISWVSSDLVYLGVNRRVADLWDGKPEDFVGQPIGFLDPASPLVEFVRTLFEVKSDALSIETQLPINGSMRNYFLFGQKYNLSSEAIILGLDVTEIRETEKSVVVERAQRFYSAKLANLGQVSSLIHYGIKKHLDDVVQTSEEKGVQSLEEDVQNQLKKVQKLVAFVQSVSLLEGSGDPSLGAGQSEQKTDLHDFMKSTLMLFQPYMKEIGVTLQIIGSEHEEPLWVKFPTGALLGVVAGCLSNSLDALSDFKTTTKEIDLELTVDAKTRKARISIVDSGKGVPKDLQGRIFEPLFTTKAAGTGSGLSVSRELMESYGGSLVFDASSPKTRFVLSVPLMNT